MPLSKGRPAVALAGYQEEETGAYLKEHKPIFPEPDERK